MRGLFFVFLIGLFGTSAQAQSLQKMDAWQDSLVALGTRMFKSEADAERLDNNFKFIKTLVSSLKESNSYYFDFKRLDMISIIESPDQNFRIFSWNIPLDDGSYLYYGTIQHKVAAGKLKLTPLIDQTFTIGKPEEDVTNGKKWYGAQYYQIVLVGSNQYALLGWKGHHREYSKKVIEIMTVRPDGEIVLGATVFSENPKLVRRIFSYTKTATMYLKYNEKLQRIEYDHIVPASERLSGNFKYYGPDLSHDAYEIKGGKLLFKGDIEVNNPDDGQESLYVDPLKPNAKQKSGLGM